jgi:hypothetical protein
MQGRWPEELLTLALHCNTMRENFNHQNHINNYILYMSDDAQASCHPNAIMFMNIVSQANYPNDEEPAVQVVGDAALNNHINPARAAVLTDDKAIWIKYGAHSFVLLTGKQDRVESFEAWAGGNPDHPSYYRFHQSVLQEPDSLGVPRVADSRPTRAQAREAIGWLMSDSVAERRQAVDRLSRAGHGGFGGDDEGDPAPAVNIHIVGMVNESEFRRRIKKRLVDAGYYIQLAIQDQQPGRLVCCHCLRYVNGAIGAANWRWRGCEHCGRYYCRQCKQLLSFGIIGTITRTRGCECGRNTHRMYN